ncbi:hypothetical protein PP336_14530 [Mycobacteroides abscessus]|uniref:hypothetical protein n=1 Tax=Mycobacteroides abscessus TaxID=36809 RepID=UPI00078C8E26|nr:hypothetical protein [Mycobacteroides abscessus]QSM04188.1 hypothetical protein PROPHIGD51-2_50 [Mycobacterium phage prophiGD51-2]AMU55773.1 hypothetical protein A3O02_11800 [Mycobacteroides abscessus]MBE5436467.1 hypothetical protein [Mycobacteroides abscessus]MBN7447553.1 hypothetical protein [Mycobacteroides abscessus subsp. abscessus]MDM1901625.1 hypothetical protein [Mycobacteroides abscessus]
MSTQHLAMRIVAQVPDTRAAADGHGGAVVRRGERSAVIAPHGGLYRWSGFCSGYASLDRRNRVGTAAEVVADVADWITREMGTDRCEIPVQRSA